MIFGPQVSDSSLKANLIFSPFCREIIAGESRVRINIYRLEQSFNWALEIENDQGGATLCTKAFDDDIDALLFAMYALQEGGIQAFGGAPATLQ